MKQALLNFIMLAPLGVFLPIVYTTMKTRKIMMILISTPLTIEVIQALGSWLMQGIWKQADINDFLFNAAGAIIGYLVYCMITHLFPSFKKFLLA
jgi:glycopeptide antibiotics resistance protein